MEAAATVEEVPQPRVGKKEKRFQCSHCQRLFARLEHLQRHERIRESIFLTAYRPGLQDLLTKGKIVVSSRSAAHNAIMPLHEGKKLIRFRQIFPLIIVATYLFATSD
jgi:hypothetical protein